MRGKETRSEKERKSSRGPGRAACVAQPRSRDPGRAAWVARPEVRRGVWFFLGFFFVFVFFFFFFPFGSDFIFAGFCWCYCFVIYRFINRVFKTRFSSSRHVEYDATSDVNKPWKSSLKDSIYRSKSSLLYSNC